MTKDEAEAVKRLELIASDGEDHEACDDVRSDIATVLDALKDEQTFVRQLRGQVSALESRMNDSRTETINGLRADVVELEAEVEMWKELTVKAKGWAESELAALRAKVARYESAMREVAPHHYVIESALKGDDHE